MSTSEVPIVCAEFESKLSGYLENELSAEERAVMDAHVLRCAACAALLRDLRTITHDAALLPTLSPSRDLWSGIAERLDSPVTSIADRATQVTPTRSVRVFSLRQFAAAAVALIAVSSGATYLLTRAGLASAPSMATSTIASNLADSNASTMTDVHLTIPASDSTSNADDVMRPASYSSGAVDVIYEREIKSMRRIVDERLGDLDSTTVVEIERNLAIIDKAIGDSRAALAKDPHSGFLSRQLDRALETKLATLRKVALL